MENQTLQTATQHRWMNTPELAEYLNTSVSSIDRFKKNNKLPYSKIGGMCRYDRELIDTWVLDHTKYGV